MLFVSKSNMQWYRSGHNEHDWKSCCRQKRHEGSNPSHCASENPVTMPVTGFSSASKWGFDHDFDHKRGY